MKEFAPIPLWKLEKGLPKHIFVRVGKSTIANKTKIVRISDNFKEVNLLGGYSCKAFKLYLQHAAI